jgi:hypothetical protein
MNMQGKLRKFTSPNGEVIYLPEFTYDASHKEHLNNVRALLIKYPLPSMTEEDIIQMKKDLEEYNGHDTERISE